jgi:5-formyltetrahydrofolate cyclo-ligase
VRLKKSGARLIGVGWPMQRLTETIPADEWDVPLNGYASSDGLELFNSA